MITGQRGGNFERLCNKGTMDETVVDGKYEMCPIQTSDDEPVVESRRYAVTYWEQHKVLLHRAFICIARDNVCKVLAKQTQNGQKVVAVALQNDYQIGA